MSKEEAMEALRKMNNIIDQWTDMKLDANDALELIAPLLATVTAYFEKEETPGEKKTLFQDLEEGLEDEKLEDLETYEPEEDLKLEQEEEDLFKKKKEEEKD